MRIKNVPSLLFTSTLAVAVLAGPALAERNWNDGIETITAAELKSLVYFLASDEMEGRDTATLANRITSQYLAHQFESMDLQHPGESKDYFQYLTLVRSRLEGNNRLEFRRGDSPLHEVGVLREDFFPASLSANGKVTAPLVLAGYGITAPELGFDEYSAIDADGKVVILFTDQPRNDADDESFQSGIRADYSSDLYKLKNAQAHGAVGVVLVHQSESSSLASAARSSWPEKGETRRFVAGFDVDQIRIPAIVCEDHKIKELIQEQEDLDFLKEKLDEQRQPQSRHLDGFEATIETQISRNAHRIRNVLAFLPGSDPLLKEELVIVSAHFDHVGKQGSGIFNGADDDASGTAGVLEIAEAFAESPVKPKRSVLFALWNAEERGLFGSRYYTTEAPVELSKTVALFQLDMIGRNQEVNDTKDRRFRGLEKQTAEENENTVHIVGFSHSNDLRELTIASNESTALDLRFELDDHPLRIIRRSDHWPFLLAGVPAVLVTTGFHPDYHKTSDTADRINYPKMERIVRFAFLCAWNAANSEQRPQLNSEGGHE